MTPRCAFLLASLLALLAACSADKAEPLPPGTVVLALAACRT